MDGMAAHDRATRYHTHQMSFRPPHLFLPLLSALAFGCGDPAASPSEPSAPDTPDASTTGTSLTLDPPSTIALAPGEPTEIAVAVEPPDVYVVRFSLLGDSLDASLDADKRVTSADGRTSVNLLAPGTPTTFRLRATAGGSATAEVAVSVSDEGFATVRVLPSYKGIRGTPTWTASAFAGVTCADIPGQPPEDGPIVGASIGGGAIELASLPVGPRIAVTLRSQKTVGGCTEISDLNPGETRGLSVKVSDMPVRLDATRLDLTMEMEPVDGAESPLLDELTTSFVRLIFPPKSTEAKSVLDAVQAQLPDPSAFAQARSLGGWDALVAAWLDESGQLLREQVRAWIERGLEPLRKGDVLAGKLTAIPGSTTQGMLSLARFHGLPLGLANIPKDHVVSLGVEPGDVMIVGGKVSWLPSNLVGAAGDVGAHDLTGATDAVHALADAVGCDHLATLLSSTYPLPSTCDGSCVESACEDALGAMWGRARNSSALLFETVQLSFTISGTATVDGDAAIVGLDASWIGTQSHDGEETAVRGAASGSLEAPQSR
jgi:hypothetical protein